MTSLGNRFSQHSFAQVPSANTPRSKFDRSFAAKDTMEFDYLTPFFLDEVLPGDTINLNVKTFMRLATQAVPLMDNMYVDFYFFFVPNRLVWDNFQKQMGEQENPGDSIDFLTPIIEQTSTAFTVGSLADHFGLPTDVSTNTWSVSALPFRCYNLVYNQWFRDQNLQNSLTVLKTDGPDPKANYSLVRSAKKHDYFTSAQPYPQKSPTPVNIPITGTAPVFGNGDAIQITPGDPSTTASRSLMMGIDNNASSNTSSMNYTGTALNPETNAFWPNGQAPNFGAPGLETVFGINDNVIITINSFREAMQLQSFLEQDMRNGTRYTEILKSHFNVISPDARLQRAEFLSAATININQHPVAQTSETGTSPQANLAAYSTVSEFGNKIGFSKSFLEHGFVMGLCRARGDVTYQQGLNRLWSRRTRYDYFWPKFQELGEQPILNQEIYIVDDFDTNQGGFGFAERYAEYRFRPSEIRGQFRSTYAESLDVWHLAEEFATAPSLNGAFIQGNTPIERALVTAVGYPALLCDYWFDYKHVRPMVAYPVPASLGRF